ncbi:MAG: FtsX-like permease family protein [Methanosarcina sp.]
MNGPITKHDYLNIIKQPDIIDAAVSGYGSGAIYKGNINDKYIELSIPVNTVLINHELIKNPSKLDIIGLNRFLISGSLKSGYPNFGYALLSWNIAKRLNVDVNDTIIYCVGDSRYEYKISGITDPTSETEFIAEDIRPLNPTEAEEDYAGNLYILSKDQKATMEYLRSYIIENNKEWTQISIEEKRFKTETSLKDALPPIVRFDFIVGGMILYLVVLLREQNIVIDYNKRNFSILTALGTSKKELIKIHATEQILIMIIVSFFAILISKFWIYQTLFKLYLPTQVVLQGATIGFALNAISLLLALFYTNRKISRVSVAGLLRGE